MIGICFILYFLIIKGNNILVPKKLCRKRQETKKTVWGCGSLLDNRLVLGLWVQAIVPPKREGHLL